MLAFGLTKALSPLLLERIIDDPDICAAAESYIDWRIFGFFFSFAAAMFRAFYIGTTQTKTLTLNSVVMVLSNVVFNYVLVFGKLGFPALGIAGAAIGSWSSSSSTPRGASTVPSTALPTACVSGCARCGASSPSRSGP